MGCCYPDCDMTIEVMHTIAIAYVAACMEPKEKNKGKMRHKSGEVLVCNENGIVGREVVCEYCLIALYLIPSKINTHAQKYMANTK